MVVNFSVVNIGSLCPTYPLKITYTSHLPTTGVSILLHAAGHGSAHTAES